MLKYFLLILTQFVFCLDFYFPDVEEYKLENGMTVLLSNNYQQPMIFFRFFIDSNDYGVENITPGISAILNRLMFEETKNYSRKELQLAKSNSGRWRAWERNGHTTAEIILLKEDLEQVFSLSSEILKYPVFKKDIFNTKTKMMIDWYRIQLSEFPLWQLNRHHAYNILTGREYQTIRDLKNISFNNVIRFHESYYQPQNITLMIVGDFNNIYIKDLLNKYFADWVNTSEKVSPKQYSSKNSEGITVRFVENPEAKVSSFTIAMPGWDPDSKKDFYSLEILKKILGSGWNSRFYNNITTMNDNRWDVFFINHIDKNIKTLLMGSECNYLELEKTFNSMVNEIRKIRQNDITSEELKVAKLDIINSSILNFEDPIDYSYSILWDYNNIGLTLKEISQFEKYYASITIDEINQVAQKYLDHENFYLVISGNKDSSMTFLNQFENIEYYYFTED